MGHGRSSALLFLLAAVSVGCVGRHEPKDEPAMELPPSGDDALRLVTFNAWGVPFRDRHDDLLDELATVLERYAPDVVVLQEIWFEDDAQRVAESLRAIGLTHEVHHASDAVLAYDSAGLMIASRWPIAHHELHTFRAGTLPIRPWHVDWFSGKGVATATIDHPSGRYRIGTAHMQADYEGVVYTDVRLSQGAELVAAMGWRPVHAVAGDFNSRANDLEHRMLEEALGVRSVGVGRGVDDILVREGVAIRDSWKLAAPAVELDGESMAISDHPVVIADLAIEEEPGEPALSPELKAELETFFDERARFRAFKRTGGWALVLFAFFLVGLSARHRKRGGRAWIRVLLLALALASTLGAYRGVGVGSARDVWRDQARAILLAEP